jgi:uncharacterized membrane protein affecting hemolysin expression
MYLAVIVCVIVVILLALCYFKSKSSKHVSRPYQCMTSWMMAAEMKKKKKGS